MTASLRISLWMAFAALCLFTVAEVLYTELFKQAVPAELMAQYKLLDAQLSAQAILAKRIFALGEALCFAMLCNFLWKLAQPNLFLRLAHGYMFALSMMNLADAVNGDYIEAFSYAYLEYRYSTALAFVSICEFFIAKHRGKYS